MSATAMPGVGPDRPGVPDRKRRFTVHPWWGPIGVAILVLLLPASVVVDIGVGAYVPDIGYLDPSAATFGEFFLAVILLAVAIALIGLGRMPIGYPRPPFAAVNPPSVYQATTVASVVERQLNNGVPPLYLQVDDPFGASGGTPTPALGYSTMGVSVRPTRCPRCGWTGTVAHLNCPRCGLRL
jgi:hypothetical protein